jgi:hypothetical protein
MAWNRDFSPMTNAWNQSSWKDVCRTTSTSIGEIGGAATVAIPVFTGVGYVCQGVSRATIAAIKLGPSAWRYSMSLFPTAVAQETMAASAAMTEIGFFSEAKLTMGAGEAEAGAVGGGTLKTNTMGIVKQTAKKTSGRPRCTPNPKADGAHTVFRKDGTTGEITHYETYTPQTNPRNPTRWESVMRYDGRAHSDRHFNKYFKEYIESPHVHDPHYPGEVRSALPNEIPGGTP